MILTYIVFGNDTAYHQQAIFSILSFIPQLDPSDKICVLTNQPSFYNFFEGKVSALMVSEDQLKEWKGAHDFFWRIKIAGLQYVHEYFQEQDLLYVDADTFLYNDLSVVRQLLQKGCCIMHLKELPLVQFKAKTGKVMWSQTKGRQYAGIKMNEEIAMWNAGVVAVPGHEGKQTLQRALDICDQMNNEGVRPKLIEQLAFSMALQYNGKLQEAKKYIAHYWGNKDGWNHLIQNFLLDNFFKNKKWDEMAWVLKAYDFNQIPLYIRSVGFLNKVKKWVYEKQKNLPAIFLRDQKNIL